MFVGLVLWLAVAEAAFGRPVSLDVPPGARSSVALVLEVTIGPMPRGTDVLLTTGPGRLIAAISPFGPGAGAGSYSVPVPPDVLIDDRLLVFVAVEQSGRARRPATPEEVSRIRLIVRHPTRPPCCSQGAGQGRVNGMNCPNLTAPDRVSGGAL